MEEQINVFPALAALLENLPAWDPRIPPGRLLLPGGEESAPV